MFSSRPVKNSPTPLIEGKNRKKHHLVGGFKPSEKYEFVNWDDDIPNMWKHKIHVPVTTNQIYYP